MEKSQNKMVVLTLGALVLEGLLFYGGMQYEKSQAQMPQGGQGRFGQGGQRGGRGGNGNGANGGFVNGEVLAVDGTSITVKLRDGGSKIIFFSDSTPVMKTTEGTTKDLAIGKQINVMGKPNSDGSINAESIQIRPAMPMLAPSATTAAPAQTPAQ